MKNRKKRARRIVSSDEFRKIELGIRGLVKKTAKIEAGDNRRIDHDDLTQPALMRVWRGANLFDKKRGVKFSTYITPGIERIIRLAAKRERKALKMLRTSLHAHSPDEEENLFLLSLNNMAAPDPSMEADKKAKLEEIKKAMKSSKDLCPTERKVLRLFKRGLAMSEIAEQLETTRNAVYLAFGTAVRKIREEIKYRRLVRRLNNGMAGKAT